MKNTKPKEFSWRVRVYYEDTDSGGVVYYANYLKFMERARTELLRNIGLEQDIIQREMGIVFAVVSANIQYKKPARFNNELDVITSITDLGKASIHFKQSVMSRDGRYAENCREQFQRMSRDGRTEKMLLHFPHSPHPCGSYVAKSQEGGAAFRASTVASFADAAVVPAPLLSTAIIKIACVNAATFSPQSIPASIIKKIKQEYFCGN